MTDNPMLSGDFQAKTATITGFNQTIQKTRPVLPFAERPVLRCNKQQMCQSI